MQHDENAVAQALSCQDPDLRYYHNSKKGEVDFLVVKNDGVLLQAKSGSVPFESMPFCFDSLSMNLL